jgi:3-dehydro-L-gulonate 2-dehydrogenase
MPSALTIRVSVDEMQSVFEETLRTCGYAESQAQRCASVFVQNSLEGVYTHGVNRFGRFVRNTRDGLIVPQAVPTLKTGHQGFEQWDGNRGPGPLNAYFCTDRAMTLADANGIGCVALGNSNHWMRGGSYGWHAARAGYALIAWTNTVANMPVWGGKMPKLGNNPMVFAIPYKEQAVVLDFAMSQYSYGKLESARAMNEQLPVPAGYDANDQLTNDPAQVLQTGRVLQTGFWKGAGLSLMLDLLAAGLSGGLSVGEVTAQGSESRLSQVYIALNMKPSSSNLAQTMITHMEELVDTYRADGSSYPGERAIKLREENLKLGIPVLDTVWKEIAELNSR